MEITIGSHILYDRTAAGMYMTGISYNNSTAWYLATNNDAIWLWSNAISENSILRMGELHFYIVPEGINSINSNSVNYYGYHTATLIHS